MSIPSTARQYRVPKCDGIDNLVLTESPVKLPVANDVLVKIHATALNYRDLALITGAYPQKLDNPIPCSDGAGEVIAIGDRVKQWKVGDRVACNFNIAHLYGDLTDANYTQTLGSLIDGTLTEYQIFPAEALVSIPDHLSYEEASTLPCAAVTAWNALHGPVPIKGGDTILALGTGGVSIFAIQFAHALGATVIATSSSAEKLKVARELGADHLINYNENPDWEKEVLQITGGRGVDHVIECGGVNTMLKSIACLRYAGWIHNIGFLGGFGAKYSPSDITNHVLLKSAFLRGILVGSHSQFRDMNRLISARKIVPHVDKVFEFSQAKEAYLYLASQKHVGKVVIRVAGQ